MGLYTALYTRDRALWQLLLEYKEKYPDVYIEEIGELLPLNSLSTRQLLAWIKRCGGLAWSDTHKLAKYFDQGGT